MFHTQRARACIAASYQFAKSAPGLAYILAITGFAEATLARKEGKK